MQKGGPFPSGELSFPLGNPVHSGVGHNTYGLPTEHRAPGWDFPERGTVPQKTRNRDIVPLRDVKQNRLPCPGKNIINIVWLSLTQMLAPFGGQPCLSLPRRLSGVGDLAGQHFFGEEFSGCPLGMT